MGAAGGLFFSVGEIGGFLGPLLIGVLADLTGSFTVGILALAAIVLTMVVPGGRIGQHEDPPTLLRR